MSDSAVTKYRNACPRNCYSSCTMISYVENEQLIHIEGDPNHPYTKGNLCAKGYAYKERNEHPDRLKFPYYQDVKGSGRFKQITWKMAFDLIIREMMSIQDRSKSFRPIALYKGTGNLGVHHYVTDEFFASLGEITQLYSDSTFTDGMEGYSKTGVPYMPPISTISHASMIIIWGANPSATNIHLIPFIFEAKIRGAKLVVIDPLYTQTAEMADLYIQLRPGTDGALALLLLKKLIEMNPTTQRSELDELIGLVKKIDVADYLAQCEIDVRALDMLVDWFNKASTVAHILGNGLERHAIAKQNINRITALANFHGDLENKESGIFFKKAAKMIFTNQQLFRANLQNRQNQTLSLKQLPESRFFNNKKHLIDMLWVSGANPVTQSPLSQAVKTFFRNVPFVVTVEQFLTPTAQMSNLVLPTTSHFEEFDIVTNCWHEDIAINEKAIPPYFQARSEWWIMNELASRLKEIAPELCSFPLYCSEEEYLNAQFNDQVFKNYQVKNLADLKNRKMNPPYSNSFNRTNLFTKTDSDSIKSKKPVLQSLSLFSKGKTPNKEYPFWLLTPHHPYKLNSQFHFLKLAEDNEAYVGIHPKIGERLGIFNGEVINVFNEQASMEIKAVYSSQVPEDVVFIYQGWYPDSEVNVNQLIPSLQTDIGGNTSGARGNAFYDAFVNISKF